MSFKVAKVQDVAQGAQPDQFTVVSRERKESLADLDPDAIDVSCLLIIGSSRTRVGHGGVWTPRATDPPSR